MRGKSRGEAERSSDGGGGQASEGRAAEWAARSLRGSHRRAEEGRMRGGALVVGISGVLVGAWGDDDGEGADMGAAGPATIVTWNLGLAPGFVDFAAERAQLGAEAVAGLDADVVCLQEVWQEEDVAKVLAAT